MTIQSIGTENQPIIDAITKAKKVAVQLCHQGFRVLDINIGTRNPVIHISPSKRCEALGGTWIKRQQGNTTALITMAASIDGVQVEWTIPDHG